MARQAIVRLVDDLDESIIENGDGQTVSFGLNGTDYEIDLTNEHADELRAALARFVGAARKTARRAVVGETEPAAPGAPGRASPTSARLPSVSGPRPTASNSLHVAVSRNASSTSLRLRATDRTSRK